MIVLKRLAWNNCFSYGEGNEIDFSKNTITQVLGENGHGKSSIILILQEVLYGKNSKGIKKADIPNRVTNTGKYDITLELSIKDRDLKIVHTRVGNKMTLELYDGENDISEHTSTNTYKKIESLLGLSFEDFCQLVYQSSDSSLEFLKATDTTRKKFLISLLNLDYYGKLEEKTKKILSVVSTERIETESKYKTIMTWLDKVNKEPLETIELREVPPDPEEIREEIARLRVEHEDYASLSTKITDNNSKKARRQKLEKLLVNEPQVIPTESLLEETATLRSEIKAERTKKQEYESIKDTCPTCNRVFEDVDTDLIKSIIDTCNSNIKIKQELLNSLTEKLEEAKNSVALKEQYDKLLKEYDSIHVDDSLPEEVTNNLDSRLDILQKVLKQKLTEIKDTINHNEAALKHNAKVENLKNQIEEYSSQKDEVSSIFEAAKARESRLEVLKQAFSTKGLVAYKIENMIKDLEDLINQYLLDFSNGRFTIEFTVSNDKLNIGLTDNGQAISITALSSGEMARVNTSTLLAIRKLLNALSSNKLNLLFLDEVLNVLDEDGRQKLISVLSEEQELNSFIVSHGWYHPLVARVQVHKEKGISSIRED